MDRRVSSKAIKYSIEQARDGNPTLIVYPDEKGVYLHSRVNPLREGGLLDDLPDPSRFDLLIVLGCGLGYSLTGLRETLARFTMVIIVDIIEGIENSVVANPHTSFLQSGGNVKFITGAHSSDIDSKLTALIDLGGIKGIKIVEHTQSFRVFNTYYSDVKKIISRIIDRKAGSLATINAFGNLFLRNAINNISNMKQCRPVSSLDGLYHGCSALIVSSAPSVEYSINDIISCRERVYVIAVDSALPILRCHGITPDFVVSIDPQPRIGEHFLGHIKGGAVHIFSLVSPPELVSTYGGFITLNSHPVSQIIDDICPGVIGSIDSATGSVAGDAFLFALKAGFDYIAMTGFDFSFSRNIIYARESAYQTRYARYFNNRFRTAETFNAEYIFRSSNSLVVDGRYTRRSFVGYRDSLDSLIAESGFRNIFMMNRLGLPLANASDISLDSFMSLNHTEKKHGRDLISGIGFKPVCELIDLNRITARLSEKNVLPELIRGALGADTGPFVTAKVLSLINRSRDVAAGADQQR